MEIKVYGHLEQTLELDISSIPQLIPALESVQAPYSELVQDLLEHEYYYFVTRKSEPENFINLIPQVISSDLAEFDTLLLVPHVKGNTGIETGILIAGALGITSVGASVAFAIALSIATSIALSVALAFIAQLLSPTLSFDSDPAQAQTLDSSLFNGAPNIREQGGSVPIVVGECHMGGVLISAGISSYGKTI